MSAVILCAGLAITLAVMRYVLDRLDDVNEKLVTMLLYTLGCIIIMGVFITEKLRTYESDILADHIDTDKTRVIKENGEVRELYITVEGKEYHFTFKED